MANNKPRTHDQSSKLSDNNNEKTPKLILKIDFALSLTVQKPMPSDDNNKKKPKLIPKTKFKSVILAKTYKPQLKPANYRPF